MKKIVAALSLFAVFASCKQKAKEQEKPNVVLLQDTFQMHNNSVLTDKNGNTYTLVPTEEATAPVAAKKTTTTTHKSSGTATRPTTTTTRTSNSTVANTPAKKKGWSNKAKGAAIGAGSGAVAGAVIAGDGNRAKGAIIGTVVGAAGGYIIGKAKDKKEANKDSDQ